MRIWSLVFVFGLGLGCSGGARSARVGDAAAPPPVAASSPKLCRGGGPALNLPTVEWSHDLKLDVDRPGGVEPEDWKGKMTVDGVVTASMWPMRAPGELRLADGRHLLYDGYNANLVMLWDPKTRVLTELGRGMLMPVDGRGFLIYTGDDATGVFSDIDPAAPRLREIYRFERAEENAQPAGVIDGMPVLVSDASGSSTTLLCLTAAGVSGRIDVTIPAGFSSVGVDPIDGHRMLLLEDIDQKKLWTASGQPPFDAEVRVLDLVTGKVRSLGRVDGGWTVATNMPHPVLRVGWNDGTHDTTVTSFTMPDGMITLVDPKTEALGIGVR